MNDLIIFVIWGIFVMFLYIYLIFCCLYINIVFLLKRLICNFDFLKLLSIILFFFIFFIEVFVVFIKNFFGLMVVI